jgi:hypothetical protein
MKTAILSTSNGNRNRGSGKQLAAIDDTGRVITRVRLPANWDARDHLIALARLAEKVSRIGGNANS